MKRTDKVYYYRGDIERFSMETGYSAWIRGYSPNSDDGRGTYPWSGKRMCQTEAKKAGYKAVFVETRTEC